MMMGTAAKVVEIRIVVSEQRVVFNYVSGCGIYVFFCLRIEGKYKGGLGRDRGRGMPSECVWYDKLSVPCSSSNLMHGWV